MSGSTLNTTWRKSSRSNADGACVEARRRLDEVQVRDTKNRRGPVLSFTTLAWRRFISDVQSGHYDR